MNKVGKIKDVFHYEYKKRLKFKIIYLLVPMYVLTEFTSYVSQALEYLPFPVVRDTTLSVYNAVFGTLNDLNLVGPLLIFSMFGLMFQSLWERRRRTPVKWDRISGSEAVVRASAATVVDWVFASLLFISASLDLLDVLATSPEWVSTTVSALSYSMLAASFLQDYIKKKMKVAGRDPTEKIFDPERLAKKIRRLFSPQPERPLSVTCLVMRE